MTKQDMILWLKECSKYFANLPTKGEDMTYWSNTHNSHNAKKIAEYLEKN